MKTKIDGTAALLEAWQKLDGPTSLLDKWEVAKIGLDHYKKQEAELRAQIVETFFQSNDTGTFHHDAPDGRDLVCVKKDNYNLDAERTYEAAHTIADAIGPALATRLIIWKPTLSVSEYKKLTNEQRDLLRDCLTIKPATPTLELRVKK